MFIDTHSHIYSEEFNGEFDDVVERAVQSGVSKILLPNIDSSSIKRMFDLSDKYPQYCYPMMGIHPTSVKEDYKEELEVVEYWLKKRKFVAIGEIGIDLYWDSSFIEEQQIVFRKQLQFAINLNLPVVIHMRDSYEVVYENLLKEYKPGLKGVFHCFSGNIDQAHQVLALGFKIGIGGTVTFKNSGIDKLVEQLLPTDIILETDSPYLAPTPYRGKRNESSYLRLIAQRVAEIYGITELELAKITSKTAKELFNLA